MSDENKDESIPRHVVTMLRTFANFRRQHAKEFRHQADNWEDAGYPKTAKLLRELADKTDELANVYDLPTQ